MTMNCSFYPTYPTYASHLNCSNISKLYPQNLSTVGVKVTEIWLKQNKKTIRKLFHNFVYIFVIVTVTQLTQIVTKD